MDLHVERIDAGGPRLRIAVVTETYPPEVNGVALSLSRLVRALVDRQHTVQLIRVRQPADTQRGAGEDVLMRGVPIPRYPGLRMGLPCKGHLVRLWSHQRPDVVHIATEGPLGWSALRAARQLKLPVSSEFRTNFHAYSRHYGLGVLTRSIMAVLKRFHNAADLTMVPTAALRDDLQSCGFRNLTVVGRGVDVSQFHPSFRSGEWRAQWGLEPTDLAIVCFGRLAAEKNLSTAVRAFEDIQRRRPDARLIFIGDGPLRDSLHRQCPQAIFTGMLRGPALSSALASCDLFLFPSETETFGNVVVEAMASGLPVVAYRMAAAAEVIQNGCNGWTAEPGQPESFTAVALKAASMSVSDRWQVSERAANTAASLDWQRIALQVEQQLLLLLDPPSRGATVEFSDPSWVGRS